MSIERVEARDLHVGDRFLVTAMGGEAERIVQKITNPEPGRVSITSDWGAGAVRSSVVTDEFNASFVFRVVRNSIELDLYLLVDEMLDHFGLDNPCQLDHHGHCQEHGHFGEGDCIAPRAKRVMERFWKETRG